MYSASVMLCRWRERLGLDFARAPHQDFDARFGFFQLLAAGVAQLHAALEQFEGALQRQLAAFHFLDDGFQLLESRLEGEGRIVPGCFRHRPIIGLRVDIFQALWGGQCWPPPRFYAA